MIANPSLFVKQFNCHGSNLSEAWAEYEETLENLFEANKVAGTEVKQRLNVLFLVRGPELRRIYKTLHIEVPNRTNGGTNTEYDKAIYRLRSHFNAHKNKVVERLNFRRAGQNPGETIAEYVARLRILANHCAFDNVNHEIVQQVVEKCSSSGMRGKFLVHDELDIEKLLKLGRAHNSAESDVEAIPATASASTSSSSSPSSSATVSSSTTEAERENLRGGGGNSPSSSSGPVQLAPVKKCWLSLCQLCSSLKCPFGNWFGSGYLNCKMAPIAYVLAILFLFIGALFVLSPYGIGDSACLDYLVNKPISSTASFVANCTWLDDWIYEPLNSATTFVINQFNGANA
jgi:hypothetical protein